MVQSLCELVGFPGGGSSPHVCRSHFMTFDLSRTKQELCAVKIEIFSKLYSGPLEIIIINKLHYPKNLIPTEV